MKESGISIATAQTRISADVRTNSILIQKQMRKASKSGARLIHFPEGALSGYVKNQIFDWEKVDWKLNKLELEKIARLAGELKIWTILGSNHKLSHPNRPHNSLYVISDTGEICTRYDKRFISNSELSHWYTPGAEPVVFEVDGFKFGLAICIEINFAEIFMQYEKLGVDCMLCSSYSEILNFGVIAHGHAAMNCYWFSLSVPANVSKVQPSIMIGPDGKSLKSCRKGQSGMIITMIDPLNPGLNKALNRSRPWRKKARTKDFYSWYQVDDPRSQNRRNF